MLMLSGDSNGLKVKKQYYISQPILTRLSNKLQDLHATYT